MTDVVIVDTSVFANILAIPRYDQNRQAIKRELLRWVDRDASLLLPLACIFETGNIVARIGDGNLRRRYARKFCEQADMAIEGTAPWAATPIPEMATIQSWLAEFPDHCMVGRSLTDFSIVKAWENACLQFPSRRVLIWSIDQHLHGFDRTI